jgi:topoisomerase-4 subunit A
MDVEEYDDGNGKVKVRAAIEAKKDSKEIVIKEIPYGVTTESLINSIEAAAKKNKIKIAAINDYTTDRVEIEIKAARGVSNEDTIKSLYAFTDCQVSISVNCILIKENKPVNVGVSEILKYNTDVLVQLLKRELEIKLGELEDTLHYKTLEMIFIENRVYKKIEECKTYESVIKAVYDGMNKFKHLFIRELIDEDIERLLKIVIRRISRYDINKARKDLDDIVREIKKIQSNLKQMKRFTVKFINDLLKKYKEFYPRCTKIGNVIEVDKSEVALANLKLGYDKLSGTIGTSVKSDSYLSVTSYDKILVINKKGEYKVISVSDKEFVDKDVIYYGIVDSEKVFTIVYQNKKNKFYFAKRFNIDKFIMKKTYRFFAEDGKLKLFSSDDIQKLEINYAKKPKMKKLKEVLFLKNIPIKNVSVIGTKISSKEILKVKVGK